MYLEELRKADHDPVENGAEPTIPPWLDIDKFNRGRQFFIDHLCSCLVSMLVSLVVGLSVQNIREPLIFTEQSDNPQKSCKRYISTTIHLLKWHYGDVWNSLSGRSHKSIMYVRKIHEQVAKDMTEHANRMKVKGKTMKQKTTDGTKETVFVSQYDMSLVQSGFFGMITMYPEAFGVEKNVSLLDDYIYFWKGIGYLLGISDKNNICNDGYSKAYSICKEIENDIVVPALIDPCPDFNKLVNAFIDGVHLMTKIRLFTYEVISLWIFRCSGANIFQRKPTFFDNVRFCFIRCLFFGIRYCGPIRRGMNRLLEKVFACDKMK